MVFTEQKKENKYHYECEDVFGKLEIDSDKQLSATILDELVVFFLRQSTNAQIIKGATEHENARIEYVFTKTPDWSDDDDEDEEAPCENTPTSTNEQANESQAQCLSPFSKKIGRIWSWSQKYVEALREAWRSGRKYLKEKENESKHL